MIRLEGGVLPETRPDLLDTSYPQAAATQAASISILNQRPETRSALFDGQDRVERAPQCGRLSRFAVCHDDREEPDKAGPAEREYSNRARRTGESHRATGPV